MSANDDTVRRALERFVTFHSGHVLPPELRDVMKQARAALAAPAPTRCPECNAPVNPPAVAGALGWVRHVAGCNTKLAAPAPTGTIDAGTLVVPLAEIPLCAAGRAFYDDLAALAVPFPAAPAPTGTIDDDVHRTSWPEYR